MVLAVASAEHKVLASLSLRSDSCLVLPLALENGELVAKGRDLLSDDFFLSSACVTREDVLLGAG